MRKNSNVVITTEDKKIFLKELDFLEKRLNSTLEDNFDKKSSITKKGGRPYKNSPKEIMGKGVGYFRRNISLGRPLTITGLSLALGISRRQMINWEYGRPDDKGSDNQPFKYVMGMLKNFAGYYYETMGNKARNPYFFIFVLGKMWKIKRRK